MTACVSHTHTSLAFGCPLLDKDSPIEYNRWDLIYSNKIYGRRICDRRLSVNKYICIHINIRTRTANVYTAYSFVTY